MTFAAGAVVAICIHPAFSQTASPPLTYIQPVPPAGVQAVRSRLRDAGDYHGSVDGVWGPDSVSALRRFQADHQLQATGKLNQATAALNLDPLVLLGVQQANLPPPPSPTTLASVSVRTIQDKLSRPGFYNGGVDGVWGQSTQTAIQRLQENRGLQPNGQLNAGTLAAMGVPPDSMAYR
ncbi:MAG TPA: peptidoglycan-binding domain-containing protein [Rhodopila sp.]|nr:peptidoglycan-binding domain-containing protein [Rhodopila sp.]